MSASAIADGLITNLGAASVLGSGGASKNYRVLENTSGCCAVVSWSGGLSVPVSFGTSEQRAWTHTLELFLKDTGDHPTVMNNTYDIVDTVIASLESDMTIQGTVEVITEVRARHNPGEALSVGGMTWLPITMEVDSTEFP